MNLQKYKAVTDQYKSEFALFKDKFFPVTMQMEGGGKLHNVAGDSGGWTIWGIAYNYQKHLFSSFEDFKDTTRDEAAHFAFVEFYLKIKADRMPCGTKLKYFDMAYNMGTDRVIKMMQGCAGVAADGQIGAKTLGAMSKVTKDCLKAKRDSYYRSLGSKPAYSKFLKGWLSRSDAVYDVKF